MGRLFQFRHRGDDVSGEAIVDGFAAGEPKIPLRIFFYFLDGLADSLGKEPVEAVLHQQHFLGLDADVGDLAADVARGAWSRRENCLMVKKTLRFRW